MPNRKPPRSPLLRLLQRLCIVSMLSCSKTQPPCPPRPPAQITVTPDKTPCDLPAKPQLAVLAGTPDPSDQTRLIVTTDTLAEIARYHVAVSAWINAASTCLNR